MANTPPRRQKKSVTSSKDWKKSANNNELDLPSGNVCKIRRPGLPKLLAEGILPDILTPIADSAIQSGRNGGGGQDKAVTDKMNDLMSSPEGIQTIFDTADRIVAHCVVEPKVFYHRREISGGTWEDIPEEDRSEEDLYTDEIDDADKWFIFQFVVGGSRDLQSFRQQFGDVVEGVGSQ